MSGINGLEDLIETLSGIKGAALDAAEAGLREGLKVTVAAAKLLAPEDTGELRGKITSETKRQGDTVTGKVIAGAGHSVYWEMGTGPVGEASDKSKAAPVGATYTSHGWTYRDPKTGKFIYTRGQPARPFLYPAVKATEGQIKHAVAIAVHAALKG